MLRSSRSRPYGLGGLGLLACFAAAGDEKELILYQHIKHVIGGGNIYKMKYKNACRYIISDKFTVIKMIHLINGKFRTPKIEYLHKAIKYFNTVHNTNIDMLPLDNSSLFSTP